MAQRCSHYLWWHFRAATGLLWRRDLTLPQTKILLLCTRLSPICSPFHFQICRRSFSKELGRRKSQLQNRPGFHSHHCRILDMEAEEWALLSINGRIFQAPFPCSRIFLLASTKTHLLRLAMLYFCFPISDTRAEIPLSIMRRTLCLWPEPFARVITESKRILDFWKII